jgi:hypothetical protein
VPNAGLRLTAGGKTLAYTGDTGPSPDLLDLAREADLFLAEATFPTAYPPIPCTTYQARARLGRMRLAPSSQTVIQLPVG